MKNFKLSNYSKKSPIEIKKALSGWHMLAEVTEIFKDNSFTNNSGRVTTYCNGRLRDITGIAADAADIDPLMEGIETAGKSASNYDTGGEYKFTTSNDQCRKILATCKPGDVVRLIGVMGGTRSYYSTQLGEEVSNYEIRFSSMVAGTIKPEDIQKHLDVIETHSLTKDQWETLATWCENTFTERSGPKQSFSELYFRQYNKSRTFSTPAGKSDQSVSESDKAVLATMPF